MSPHQRRKLATDTDFESAILIILSILSKTPQPASFFGQDGQDLQEVFADAKTLDPYLSASAVKKTAPANAPALHNYLACDQAKGDIPRIRITTCRVTPPIC